MQSQIQEICTESVSNKYCYNIKKPATHYRCCGLFFVQKLGAEMIYVTQAKMILMFELHISLHYNFRCILCFHQSEAAFLNFQFFFFHL